ncbi:MAG: TatD family hydrolase [Candidatus Magasanikbacteria bacterium]|nr:TatD family hydrolase [Candidatus Magasanikbacteria bacterium]
MLFDTHCHIQFKSFFEDRAEVIARCKEKGMVLNLVGTQIPTSQKAIELAEQYEWMYASVGIHPIQHDVVDVEEEDTSFRSRGEQFDEVLFEHMARHSKVIAIGETGLDKFHIAKDKTLEEIFAKQKKLFLQHWELSQKVNKPLVIHVRDAHEEMIELISNPDANRDEKSFLSLDLGKTKNNNWNDISGVIHCFTSNWTHAQQYLDMGLYLGFTGVITFPPKKTDPKSQEELLEVIEKCPLDRMLVETDSPYLAPQKYRGTRSEPWMVEEVIAQIAEVKKMHIEEVERQIFENSQRLFKIA